MIDHPWAENRQKLARAVGELGADASEDALKARYIEMAGRVLNDDGTKEAPATDSTDEVVEEKPKKKKK
jgi:hypothetical protein